MKQISKKALTEDVNAGMKMDQLATKYELNANQMKTVMKEAGLKIKKTAVKRFILLDDTVPTVVTENTIN